MLITTTAFSAGVYFAWKGYSEFARKTNGGPEVNYEVIPVFRLPVCPWCEGDHDQDSPLTIASIQSTTSIIASDHGSDPSSVSPVQSRVHNTSDENMSSDISEEEISEEEEKRQLCLRLLALDYVTSQLELPLHPVRTSSDFDREYLTLKHLGFGAYGTVYAGADLISEEFVAIKRIPFRNTVNLVSAMKEVEMMRWGLGSPALIDYHSHHILDCGEIVIVMDLAEGCLSDFTTTAGLAVTSPQRAWDYFYGIKSAISFIHCRFVAHRDLKPDNILIKSGRAVLGDLGSAQRVGHPTEDMEVPISGRVGTFHYMAPEVRRDDEPYSALKADIWAFGCTIFFMLTGRQLFCADDDQADVIMDLPPSLRTHEIVVCLEAVLKSMVQLDPKDRPFIYTL